MRRLHPLGWFLLGIALAGVTASLAQVYGFFPPPGMTYTQQSATQGSVSVNKSLSVVGSIGAGTDRPTITLSNAALSGSVGTYFAPTNVGAPYISITENVNTNAAFSGVCNPGGPGGLPQINLTGECEWLGVDGSQTAHVLSGSFDVTFFDVRTVTPTTTESPSLIIENAANKFYYVGQLTGNTASGTCLDANGPNAPCALLGNPPDPYPVCIGQLNAFIGFECLNWDRINFEISTVHNTTALNVAVFQRISATQINSTVGENTLAASTTNIVGGTPANTQVNGVPIAGVFRATSASIGGGALAAGACASTTTTVTGATTAMLAASSPTTDPGVGFYWQSLVSAANSVVTRVCATVAGTPTASTYLVRVFL